MDPIIEISSKRDATRVDDNVVRQESPRDLNHLAAGFISYW